ncbi:MAG: 8-amino-7-oxononanoate synthase, partial [Candidatus Aenigmarchaeota archaeon]|nr:8-amino-7-oxononanoate synthase [Candidatus Aenigmarchaeota archaeon]
ITPIMIGDNNKAQDFAKLCFEAGVMGVPIVFPMVAKGTARIRTIITAAHTKEDMNEALSVFENSGRKLGII